MFLMEQREWTERAASLSYDAFKALPLEFWRVRPVPLKLGWREELYTLKKDASGPKAAGGEGGSALVDVHALRFDAQGKLRGHSVSTHEERVYPGTLLAAKPTSSRQELVLLVGHPAPSGRSLRLMLVKLDTLELLPMCIECPLTAPEDMPPPGAKAPQPQPAPQPPAMAKPDLLVTPFLEPTQSDYVYVYAASEFAIFSLNTGRRMQPRMSDAEKGFTFIMRGLTPGSFPPWRFEITTNYSWMAQYCPEVAEIRLRYLEASVPVPGGEDMRLWQGGRELTTILGRTRQPLDVTNIKWYSKNKTLMDLADDERLCRLLVYDMIDRSVAKALKREEMRAELAKQRNSRDEDQEIKVPLSLLGQPPFGRVPPLSWYGEDDSKYNPEWFR
jgi:hypothetical protein